MTDAKAGQAQAEDALENAARAVKRELSSLRRVLREIRQSQEALSMGMDLHYDENTQSKGGHSEQ